MMSVIDKLAYSLGRRDEVPNQELARDLAAKKDKKDICEVAENLWNKNKNIQADCIKVLEKRTESLSGGGVARVKKIIKQAQAK